MTACGAISLLLQSLTFTILCKWSAKECEKQQYIAEGYI